MVLNHRSYFDGRYLEVYLLLLHCGYSVNLAVAVADDPLLRLVGDHRVGGRDDDGGRLLGDDGGGARRRFATPRRRRGLRRSRRRHLLCLF